MREVGERMSLFGSDDGDWALPEVGLPEDDEQRFQSGMRFVCLCLGVIVGFFLGFLAVA